MAEDIRAQVLNILSAQECIDVSAIKDDTDLYDAGLTSFASVQLMLALEDYFCFEFSERMLNRRTFSTLANITASVTELVTAKAA